MKLARILNLVLAISLAVLLPLEQAHCAWMGLEKSASRGSRAMSPGHECCRSLAKSVPNGGPRPKSAPQACMCETLPKGAMPAVVLLDADAHSLASFVTPAVASVVSPVAIVTETVPALDVGCSPPPHATAAHGLRAPPSLS